MELKNKDLRRRILEVGKEKKMGHYGSCMSCLDVIKFLYDEILKEEDIFILSKGHGAPALHAVLETKGFIPPWTIHNEYDEKNGIEATTGSLGLGLPTALGRAYAKKLMNKKGKVYCILGDGEMQEGVIWESLNIAHRLNTNNLITMVDYNKYQAITSIKEIMDEDDVSLEKKLGAFGYEVSHFNGHDYNSLRGLLTLDDEKMNAVILHTQKGRGIPHLERNPSWHVIYMHEHPEIYEEAMEHLK